MPDNIREKAYWLKMQRKRLGLTQKELARLSGASLRSIQSYEQGTRSLSGASIEQIQALCRVLGCMSRRSFPIRAASSLPLQRALWVSLQNSMKD